MNKQEWERELFSGDATRVAKAHEKLTSIEIKGLNNVVNRRMKILGVDSILLGDLYNVFKKRLGFDITREKFFETLKNNGILTEENEPTEKVLERGLIRVYKEAIPSVFGSITRTIIYITPVGQCYIYGIFRNTFVSDSTRCDADRQAKEKQIAKELEDKQEKIFDVCRKNNYCFTCVLNDIAEFKNENGSIRCKVYDAMDSTRLSDSEINEYYEVLEDYKKQEEKEVSVDDMKASLTNYCDGVKLEDCSFGGKCILRKHFRQGRCKCSSLKRLNTLSDEEVKERYNILIEHKGEIKSNGISE